MNPKTVIMEVIRPQIKSRVFRTNCKLKNGNWPTRSQINIRRVCVWLTIWFGDQKSIADQMVDQINNLGRNKQFGQIKRHRNYPRVVININRMWKNKRKENQPVWWRLVVSWWTRQTNCLFVLSLFCRCRAMMNQDSADGDGKRASSTVIYMNPADQKAIWNQINLRREKQIQKMNREVFVKLNLNSTETTATIYLPSWIFPPNWKMINLVWLDGQNN